MKKFFSVLGLVTVLGMSALPALASTYVPLTASINTPTNTTITFNTNDGVTGNFIYLYGLTAGAPSSTPSYTYTTTSGVKTLTISGVSTNTYYYVGTTSAVDCSALTYSACKAAADISPHSGFFSFSAPFTQSNTTGVSTYLGTKIAEIATMLYSNLPTVLEIMMALVGLGIAIHYVRKWVGRKA